MTGKKVLMAFNDPLDDTTTHDSNFRSIKYERM